MNCSIPIRIGLHNTEFSQHFGVNNTMYKIDYIYNQEKRKSKSTEFCLLFAWMASKSKSEAAERFRNEQKQNNTNGYLIHIDIW